MQNASARRNTGVECNEQLATSGDIQQQAFFVRESSHGGAEECLGGIHHRVVAKGRSGLRATSPQVGFVVDEQWRAVRAGQIVNIAATNDEATVHHLRSVRQEVAADRGHICSGASIPNICSPSAKIRAVRSHSANRLSRMTSLSAFNTEHCS